MAEQGVFRTKVFGGFNKKDVFRYFDELQNSSGDEIKLLKEQLKQRDETLQADAEKIKELSDALVELKSQYDSLRQKAEQADAVLAENRALHEQLSQLQLEKESDLSYKARCDNLSHKVVKAQSENMLLKTAIEKEKIKNQSLQHAIDEIAKVPTGNLSEKSEVLADLSELIESMLQIKEKIRDAKQQCE